LTDTTKNPSAIGASKVNDWFVWNDAGTMRLSHGPDWTSDTTRSAGTALLTVNGIWLNNASITNGPAAQRGTYVGTTRSNASSQLDFIFGGLAANGTAGFVGVWNMYNRRNIAMMVGDTTDSWSYATAAWRAANASNTMRVSFVSGQEEDAFSARYTSICFSNPAPNVSIGIGYDTTSTFSGTGPLSGIVGVNALMAPMAEYGTTALGFHFANAIEYSNGATSTFFGDLGTNFTQSGLWFNWRC
jgi:hypothetical protein